MKSLTDGRKTRIGDPEKVSYVEWSYEEVPGGPGLDPEPIPTTGKDLYHEKIDLKRKNLEVYLNPGGKFRPSILAALLVRPNLGRKS